MINELDFCHITYTFSLVPLQYVFSFSLVRIYWLFKEKHKQSHTLEHDFLSNYC